MRGTPEERFWAKVDRRGRNECWPWLGSTTETGGYGQFWNGQRLVPAHRFAYELLVGPIPEGLTIDHVKTRGCVRRDCVNPRHLEPVTNRENIQRGGNRAAENARKTHCDRGHALTVDNTYREKRSDGRIARKCRLCRGIRRLEREKDPMIKEQRQKYMREAMRKYRKGK